MLLYECKKLNITYKMLCIWIIISTFESEIRDIINYIIVLK